MLEINDSASLSSVEQSFTETELLIQEDNKSQKFFQSVWAEIRLGGHLIKTGVAKIDKKTGT